MSFTKQQKAKFARIIFNSPGREKQQINELTQDQLQKIRSIYAQKIAYETVNGKIEAFFHADQYPANTGPRIPNLLTSVCCCFYPSENRDYFDLTTSIFFKRLIYPFCFWNNGFFNINDGKAQQYALIWLILTYTIILGLSASLNKYFIDNSNFSFENQLMITALGIIAIFKIAQPLIYSSVIGCLGGFIYTNQSLMLSSYSLVLYFVPTIFCVVPSLYWHILMMTAGSLFRATFLFRNYSTKLQSKLYILLFVIFILEAIYLFITIKVLFASDAGYGFQQGFDAVFGTTPSISTTTAHLSYTVLRQFQN